MYSPTITERHLDRIQSQLKLTLNRYTPEQSFELTAYLTRLKAENKLFDNNGRYSKLDHAAFVRNDRILNLKPIEAVICEGSGIQQNLAQKLRQAGIPLHIVRLAHQRTAQRA